MKAEELRHKCYAYLTCMFMTCLVIKIFFGDSIDKERKIVVQIPDKMNIHHTGRLPTNGGY